MQKLLLLLLLILLSLSSSYRATEAKHRPRTNKPPPTTPPPPPPPPNLEDFFPEKLRASAGFKACKEVGNHGERGVCQLLAAFDAQLELLPKNTSSSSAAAAAASSSSSSCRFRSEGGPSLHKYATPPSPHLSQLLQRYSELHRRCTAVDGPSSLLQARPEQQQLDGFRQLRCRYVMWSCSFGLGNKLMSLVSTFLYALLSQRVLLLQHPQQQWSKLFCHPPSFRWAYAAIPPELLLGVPDAAAWLSGAANSSGAGGVTAVWLTLSESAAAKAAAHPLLVCPAAAASLRNLPLLEVRNSNQYYAPALFLNPALRPPLRLLFPRRRVFHALSRALLAPADPVWSDLRRLLRRRRLRHPRRRAGVQLRESAGEYRPFYDTATPACLRSHASLLCPIEVDEYQQQRRRRRLPGNGNESTVTGALAKEPPPMAKNGIVNGRVNGVENGRVNKVVNGMVVNGRVSKAVNGMVNGVVNGMINGTVNTANGSVSGGRGGAEEEEEDGYVWVYVASLVGGHAAAVAAGLAAVEEESGQRFEVVMRGAAEGRQRWDGDVEHQQGALVDMWALSLSDVLLTTHMSTFGYTAAGLAGITPLLLKPWPADPCWPAVSSDPCFHFAPPLSAADALCKPLNHTTAPPQPPPPQLPPQPPPPPRYMRTCPDLPDTGLQLSEDEEDDDEEEWP